MYTNHHLNRGFYYGSYIFPAILTSLGVAPLFHRKSCLKPSSYKASIIATPPTPTSEPEGKPTGSPIRVAAKNKSRRRLRNVSVDDRGFPDHSDEYDTLLHNIDGGHILRKLKHPPPPLAMVDPTFHFPFDECLHGERLCTQLNLSHLHPLVQPKVTALVKKYWSMFDERGVWVLVWNYECIIDTGAAHPIAIKKIQYGPKELLIMRKAISDLEKVGHICQMHDGCWLFKAVLATKPHQEHVLNINNFVWRFCVNYVPLNSVTRIIAYPLFSRGD
jgi:hypothetical protein